MHFRPFPVFWAYVFLVENWPIWTSPLVVENSTIFLKPSLREVTHTFVAYVRPMQFVGWYPDKKQIGQNKKKSYKMQNGHNADKTKCKGSKIQSQQNASKT